MTDDSRARLPPITGFHTGPHERIHQLEQQVEQLLRANAMLAEENRLLKQSMEQSPPSDPPRSASAVSIDSLLYCPSDSDHNSESTLSRNVADCETWSDTKEDAGRLVCQMCQQQYDTLVQLEAHMQTHKQEDRPYRCEQCGFRFKKNHELAKHDRNVHQNLRPFQCTQCDNAYKRRSHLNDHIRASHSLVTFDCPVCGVKCSRKANLKIHMARFHS
ncbi:hypothetical protein EDD86DRAFT_210051 [Gorgonomyces haynaldii]|nr:hypothetical protein EDD86DRAFT_210051 [Gorgonomyces haynaldii]